MQAHTLDCHITMSLCPTFKGFYYVVSMSVSVPPRRYSRTSFKRIPNLLPLPQNSPMSEAKKRKRKRELILANVQTIINKASIKGLQTLKAVKTQTKEN